MNFSVVIPTYNRAGDLRETIQSLATLKTTAPWEALIVDNNSSDDTRQVVEDAARTFPVDLHYVFEPEQGRSAALNAGIRRSRGAIVVTTDDDVRVEPDWLDCAGDALDSLNCDYVGGKVLPLWGAPRPAWIPAEGGKHWAVIALLDYGPDPVPCFARAHFVPLGVNMAFRRHAFDRAGLWSNRVGRKKGTLLGQEVREWMMRAREAGLQGYYTPTLSVRHLIQPDRLRKSYFRRWFYWNGVSRALLYRDAWIDMQAPDATTLDFSRVPHILGVPRFFYGKALSELQRMLASAVRRETVARFDAELWLWFFAGVVKQRWHDRGAERPPVERARVVTPVVTSRAEP